MKPSQQAIDLIKQYEGCRLEAYRDLRGIWTVGYGCTGGAIKQGTVWTQEQADQALKDRVDVIGRLVLKAVKSPLSQNQLDALTSLCYNIGQGAFRGSTLLRCLSARKYKDATQEILKWDHADGVVVEGLKRRREAEAALFCKA